MRLQSMNYISFHYCWAQFLDNSISHFFLGERNRFLMTIGILEDFFSYLSLRLPKISMPRLFLPLTWLSLSLQPHSHPGEHRCSQYSQCRVGHHAPHPNCRGPANRGYQSAGGGRLALVSACGPGTSGDCECCLLGVDRWQDCNKTLANLPW